MSKAIVYSLFGFNKGRVASCFSFESYLRGLMICIRMNRLLFPDWKIVLQTDNNTYIGFQKLFDALKEKELISISLNPDNTALCEAMLWRLKPVFETDGGGWKYTHVLCRDLDSPATFREAQAVHYWIQKDKAVHAITDSISHTVPMLGGMIGMRPRYFTERVGQTWEAMMKRNTFNLSGKGSDQDFLNTHIYPLFARHGEDSITQHYCLGMPKTFLSDWHNTIDNIDIGLDAELKESNAICGHIGSAGYYSAALSNFLFKHQDKFTDLLEIEKEVEVFYWAKDGKFTAV